MQSSNIGLTSTFHSDGTAPSSPADCADLEGGCEEQARKEISLDENGEIEGGEALEEPLYNDEEEESSCARLERLRALPYVAVYAALGCIARVFIGRFFGSDCDQGSRAPDDFLSPFFTKICVTNSGTTDQTGGALFLDLPANMMGCFLMGMITHPNSMNYPLPWRRRDDTLQQHKGLIEGLRTGLCGCWTTFASWNTQMVWMLDGSFTALGPQIVAALFGYCIGLSGAFSSFQMGRLAHECLVSIHSDAESTAEDDKPTALIEETRQDTETPSRRNQDSRSSHEATVHKTVPNSRWSGLALPSLFLASLWAAFLVGAISYEIGFYQQLLISSTLAPVGALLRWKLKDLNSRENSFSLFAWVPWGTFTANLFASLLSVVIVAIQLRYISTLDTPSWVSHLLGGTKIGLAGSLSTVSTLINEMWSLRWTRSLLYATGSLLAAMLLGLLVFSPIVRS